MYIIDIPDGTSTGPSKHLVAAAEAVALAKRKPPLVQVQVNGDDAILEAVELIRSARTQMEMLTNTINERFNVTFVGIGDKVTNIVGNIDTVTDNIAHLTNNFNQPVLFMMFTSVILMIFIVVLLFFILKTRREFRKGKILRRGSASTQPLKHPRKSSSGMIQRLRKHIPSGWRPLNRYSYSKNRRQSRDRSATSIERVRTDKNGEKTDIQASAPPLSSSVEYSKASTLKKKTSADTLV